MEGRILCGIQKELCELGIVFVRPHFVDFCFHFDGVGYEEHHRTEGLHKEVIDGVITTGDALGIGEVVFNVVAERVLSHRVVPSFFLLSLGTLIV